MTAREFLLTDPKIEEAVSNGYDIRLEEQEWVNKMEAFADYKQKLNKLPVMPVASEGVAQNGRVGLVCQHCGSIPKWPIILKDE